MELAAVGPRGVDVVRIQAPHVAPGGIRLWRALLLFGMGRAEEDALVVRVEETAGRLAGSGRDAVQAGAIDVHDEFLIAGAAVARALEDQPVAAAAEVRFGILPTIGELAKIGQMPLTDSGSNGGHGGRMACAGDAGDRDQGQCAGAHGTNVKRAPQGRPSCA